MGWLVRCWILLVAVGAGCGLVGYDPSAATGDGGPGGDGNGTVGGDGGPPASFAGEVHLLREGNFTSRSAVWSGTHWGIVYVENLEQIWFRLLEPDGRPVGDDVPVGTILDNVFYGPYLDWSSSAGVFGVAWADCDPNTTCVVKHARLDPTDGLVGPPTQVVEVDNVNRLASTASSVGFGLAVQWSTEVHFASLDTNGVVDSPLSLVLDGMSFSARLAASNDEYLVFEGATSINYSRRTQQGASLGEHSLEVTGVGAFDSVGLCRFAGGLTAVVTHDGQRGISSFVPGQPVPSPTDVIAVGDDEIVATQCLSNDDTILLLYVRTTGLDPDTVIVQVESDGTLRAGPVVFPDGPFETIVGGGEHFGLLRNKDGLMTFQVFLP